MIKGDVNLDGVVNNEDLILLQRAIAGMFKLSEEAMRAADMDNSGGKPTMRDVIKLQELLRKKVPGDVNGDGIVDERDVKKLQEAIAEIIKLDSRCFENADINEDGKLNMLDVITLQKLIAGIIDGYKANQPKRNKITIQLGEFEKGEYLSWFATTQAANEVTVTLKDSKKTYFSAKKKSINIAPPLAVGNADYVGSNLVLEISIPQSDEIRPLPSMNTIISDTGKVLGHSFTCCGEDWTDNDYNDFYINIVGWKSKN